MTLEAEYEAGTISQFAKQIYLLLEQYKELPMHLIKQYGGFTKEDKSKFDRAITELQMRFFITMSGRARKLSNAGEEYGWSSTVFCLVEDFWGEDLIEEAEEIVPEQAYKTIQEQIYKLNPGATEKKVKKFIEGY